MKVSRNRVYATFTAMAAALALQTGTHAQALPNAEDLQLLNEMFTTAGEDSAFLALEACSPTLDSRPTHPLGNKDVGKILQMNEYSAHSPDTVVEVKAAVAQARAMGFIYCFDGRLIKSEHAASIHYQQRVIGINPVPLLRDKPLLSQQMTVALTLRQMFKDITDGAKGRPDGIALGVTIHPGSLFTDVYSSKWTRDTLELAPLKNAGIKQVPDTESKKPDFSKTGFRQE